jgi:hypothetical protein
MGLQKSHNDCNIQHYHFLRYGVGAELDAHPQLFSLLPTSPAYRRDGLHIYYVGFVWVGMANMLESDCIADKYMDGVMPFLPFKMIFCLVDL